MKCNCKQDNTYTDLLEKLSNAIENLAENVDEVATEIYKYRQDLERQRIK